jgi:hypothetical protein
LFSTCLASCISTLKTPCFWIFSNLFNLCNILHFNLDYQTQFSFCLAFCKLF